METILGAKKYGGERPDEDLPPPITLHRKLFRRRRRLCAGDWLLSATPMQGKLQALPRTWLSAVRFDPSRLCYSWWQTSLRTGINGHDAYAVCLRITGNLGIPYRYTASDRSL